MKKNSKLIIFGAIIVLFSQLLPIAYIGYLVSSFNLPVTRAVILITGFLCFIADFIFTMIVIVLMPDKSIRKSTVYINIGPHHARKLNELEIYDRFVVAMINDSIRRDITPPINKCREIPSFFHMLQSAFPWKDTIEGHDFWYSIATRGDQL